MHEFNSEGQMRARALSRIFQKILTNVASHAHATLVEVSMWEQNGILILSVTDNGVGIVKPRFPLPVP